MLLASIFVARFLGKTSYGELGILQSTISMLGVFAGFGLGLTTTKHIAEYRVSDPSRAGRIMAISSIFALLSGATLSLILFVFSPWLAQNSLNAPHLTGVLRVASIILFISALNGAQTGALSGFESFKVIARINFIVGLTSFPTLVCGAWIWGLFGATWALVLNLAIHWLLNFMALRHEARRHKIRVTLSGCRPELPILWKFSLPAVLSSALVGPVNWTCNAFLVNQPNGYDEMAIYNVANQWHSMFIYLPGIINGVILPLLSSQITEDKTVNSRKILQLAIAINLLLTLIPVIAISIFSPYVMMLYGSSYHSGWSALVFALLTSCLIAVQSPVGQTIASSGKLWIGLVMNAGWATVFIACALALVAYGAVGLALSRFVAYLIHSAWVFLFAYYILKPSHPSKQVDLCR
jgi:O-antigen/teichoic acid export membrane protein